MSMNSYEQNSSFEKNKNKTKLDMDSLKYRVFYFLCSLFSW